MSLFFGRRSETRSMDWWGAGFDSPPSSRVVTPESATYLVPVFAAIRHIVDYGSTSDLDAYRDNGDGTRAEIAMPQFLRAQDGPGRAGCGQFIGQALYGLVADGNAVGMKVDVDSYGNPTDIVWLSRRQWSWDSMTNRWLVGGEPIASSRIVHIPWIVPPGSKLGLSPLEHCRAVISAGLSAQEYADVKRGGGIPPVHAKNEGLTLTADEADVHKQRIVAAWADGKPWVTGKDWSMDVTTIPPNQAQFVETMKLSANMIAAIYGIESREVGGESQGSDTLKYVNDESLALNRASNVRPYLQRVADAFTALMPLKQYVSFDLNAAIRTDMKTRFEIYQIERQLGTISRNEIRAAEDRPPVPGGDDYTPAAGTVKDTQTAPVADPMMQPPPPATSKGATP